MARLLPGCLRLHRIIDAATGELILDPARDYQPTGQPPGPKKKTP
jgi:hypothetical protein